MMTWLMRRFWMPISKKTGVAVSICFLFSTMEHRGISMVEIEIINAPALEEREKSGSAFYLLSVITA